MRLVNVTLRGEEVTVQIDHDGGYEYDTGAHEIEWHFADLTQEEVDALNLTPAEEESIWTELYSLEPEGFPDDVF